MREIVEEGDGAERLNGLVVPNCYRSGPFQKQIITFEIVVRRREI